MDSSKIKAIIIAALAAFAAIYLGIAAATAQTEALAWVGGMLALAGLFFMGRNVWILIPLGLSLSGQLNFIPGAPCAWYIATPLAMVFLGLRFLSRTPDFTWRWTWLDTLVVLNFVMLVQVYMRNPTGLRIFSEGGESSVMIGGKTYVDYALITAGFLILSTVKTEWKTVRVVLYLMVAIQLCDGLLGAATSFSGALAAAVSHVYGNVDYNAATAGLESTMGTGYEVQIENRLTSLPQLGMALGLFCFSFWRPITALNPLRPYRPLMVITAIVLVLMGGFRSALTRLVFLFIAAAFAHRKPQDLVLGAVLGILALSLLLVGNFTQQLPFAAQRAMAFLPIGVSQEATRDSTESSEWRFKMWRLALTSDRYIHNKLLGDGFGFTADEFKMGEQTNLALSEEAQMDFYMQKGSYHGFHVETIRFVGALGLLNATVFLIVAAMKAWQLIRYYEGRSGWHALLFVCVPYLIEPVFAWFVFGAYKGNFMTFMLGAGLLRIMDNIRVSEIAEQKAVEQQNISSPDTWVPIAVRRRPIAG